MLYGVLCAIEGKTVWHVARYGLHWVLLFLFLFCNQRQQNCDGPGRYIERRGSKEKGIYNILFLYLAYIA